MQITDEMTMAVDDCTYGLPAARVDIPDAVLDSLRRQKRIGQQDVTLQGLYDLLLREETEAIYTEQFPKTRDVRFVGRHTTTQMRLV